MGDDAQQFASAADNNLATVADADDDDDDDLLGGGAPQSSGANGTSMDIMGDMGDFESSFPAVRTPMRSQVSKTVRRVSNAIVALHHALFV